MNFEDLSQLKAIPLTFIACNAVGLLLKRSPVQNWVIPWVALGLGVVLYPLIGDPSQVPWNVRSPLAHSLVLGGLIGWASVGGHQTLLTLLRKPEDGGTAFLKRLPPSDPPASPPMDRENPTTPGNPPTPPGP